MLLARFVLLGFASMVGLRAADPFAAIWKLDVDRSEFGDGSRAIRGSTLFAPRSDGGYTYGGQIVFAEDRVINLSGPVQFDGKVNDGTLEGHAITWVSKRTGSVAFETLITDTETGKLSRTLQYSVSPRDERLTMVWLNVDAAKPAYKLVYERVPPGPALEVTKGVERAFGAGSMDDYLVTLRAGDYCDGKVEQKGGAVGITAFRPDGSRIRSFGGPGIGSKAFALQATTAGTYHIVLSAPGTEPAKSYEIKLERVLTENERLHFPPPKDKFASPRMAELRMDVESGQNRAVTIFWQEIQAKGAPLVEPLEGSEKDMLVTFVWRATPETRNVLVLWYPYAAAKVDDYKMMRLGETDVWYRTVKVRRGARFYYQLSVNDPMKLDETSFTERLATARADPLNPHHWFETPGSSDLEYVSVVEMPGAPPQPYIQKRDGVPAGTVWRRQIKSALLKNERDLSIYTPPGYQREGKPYGLLVVFDEGSYLRQVPTPVILDNLVADKRIAPMIAVLIANPSGETRNRELPPNPDLADFLNNELIPWVRQNYNVTSDPGHVVVAGSSYGGIAATYAGLRHPETFGNILCQSGSFWWSSHKPEPYAEPNYLAKEFLHQSPKLPLRFYMDAGSFEVDMNGGGGAILEPSRHMRDVLLAKGYEVHYQEFVGGHDYLSWRGTLADGLIALLGTHE